MAQKDNILQELKELQSSLAHPGSQAPYQMPVGYFDSLAERVLSRVRALEADNATEELSYLSPLLSKIPKENPYSVPSGFFDQLEERIDATVIKNGQLTPAEELSELSPLLGGLKKEMPFSVPEGYFENITPKIRQEAKVISMGRPKWIRYAAAAVVTGVIVLAGFLIFNRPGPVDPNNQSFAWVEKNLKKVSTDDINKFVEMANTDSTVIVKADVRESDEVKELMKDVPDKDIQKFLDETQAGSDQEGNDETLLN